MSDGISWASAKAELDYTDGDPINIGQLCSDPRRDGFEGLVEGFGLAAACLREIRASAALAANLLGNRFDYVASLDPADIVLGHACCEPDLAVLDRADDDDGTL